MFISMGRRFAAPWRTAIVGMAALTVATAHADSSKVSDDKPFPLSAQALVEIADFAGVTVSPDGNYAAARVDRLNVSANTGTASWHLIRLRDGALRAIASGGNPLWDVGGTANQELPIWSPDSRSIYFRALHGEELAIWRAAVDGRESKLTSEDANIEEFRLDAAHDRIFFRIGASRDAIKRAELKEYLDGTPLDSDVAVEASLHQHLPYRGRMTTLRRRSDGQYVHRLASATQALMVLNLASGLAHPASVDESRDEATLQAMALEPLARGAVAVARSGETGALAFLERDAKSEKAGPDLPLLIKWSPDWKNRASAVACNDSLCRGAVPSLAWRPESHEVLFVTDEPSGASSLRAWNTRRGSVRSVYSTDGLLGATSGERRTQPRLCPATAQVAVCTLARAAEPPLLVAIDLNTGATRTLLDPNAELRRHEFGAVEHLEWRDRWGRAVTGVLVLPRRMQPARKVPLVITSYRCEGFLRGGGGANVPEHLLAASGIAALCVNVDGRIVGDPYPSADIPRGQAANLQTILDSWESGVALLQARGLIDAARIGVSGLSLSGEAVHYAITHSDRFAAAASSHMPFTDPFSYYFFTGEIGKSLHEIYGVPPPDKDPGHWYRRFSPAMNVEKIQVPLLVQTAESELRPGLQYWYELSEQRKPAEVVVFPDEGHQFWQPAHRLKMNERFIDWFRFWLQGHESEDPGKRDQYARWRELRERWDRSSPAAVSVPEHR